MRGYAWVAVGLAQVLAACGQSAVAAADLGDAPVADAAVDAASEVAPTDAADVAKEGLSDGCGGDACGADDVQDVTADAASEVAPTDAADADAFDCAATMTALQDAISALVTSHADCQHDADCTTVSTSTACQGACGVGLNVNGVAAFQSALAALDDKFCKQSNYADQCGYATPKCIAPGPGCVNNLCVYKK
jgi:hypothetical protein